MIKMIYNNTGKCSGLENAWGLSIWIENEDDVTLFDTGGDGKILLKNLNHLDLDIQKIGRIIISHDHWDHKGGLEDVMAKLNKEIDVFVPSSVEQEYKNDYPSANIIGIDEPTKITENIWSTGPLNTIRNGSNLDEQSVIILNHDSMVILNGCSHPGIVNIVKRAKKIFPDKKITFVAGGFHLRSKPGKEVREISEELKALGVEKIAPSHCTGGKAIEIFRKEWGDRFVDMNIGDERIIQA